MSVVSMIAIAPSAFADETVTNAPDHQPQAVNQIVSFQVPLQLKQVKQSLGIILTQQLIQQLVVQQLMDQVESLTAA